jgi:hypothetical protein
VDQESTTGKTLPTDQIMNEIIYERLAKAGLLRASAIDIRQVNSAPLNRLRDLAIDICDMTSVKRIKREHEVFALSASLELSGGRERCDKLDCRIERVRHLIQFAVLYSDRVYVRNNLVDCVRSFVQPLDLPEPQLRKLINHELIILNEMRPAIEKGLIIPSSPPLTLCPHCLAKRCLGQNDRFEAMERYIYDRYHEEVSVKLLKEDDQYVLHFEGPDSLVDHGAGWLYLRRPPGDSIPEMIRSMPRAVRKADAGGEALLSRAARERVGLNAALAEAAMKNVSFELLSAQSFGASFLTDNLIHVEALDVLSGNSDLERRNSLVREHLTSIVPFVEGVSVDGLIKLREEEGDSFILYRQALNQAIDEYRAHSYSFTEKEARALYGDVIAPKLAAMDNKIKSARKSLFKGTAVKIGAWTGAIAFGLYAGFVPPQLAAAAEALGLTQVAAELAGSTMTGLDADQHVREDSLYFLWKVRQLSRKS